MFQTPRKITIAMTLMAACVLALLPAAGATAAVTATFSGTIDPAGSSWRTHTFDVGAEDMASHTLTLSWEQAGTDLNLGLRSPSGSWVQWAAGTTQRPEELVYSFDQAGTWTVGIKAKSGAATPYQLMIEPGSAPPPPPPSQSGPWTGALDSAGTKFRSHVFVPETLGEHTFRLDWDPASADLNLGLRSPSGSWVRWASSASNRPETITFDVDVAGEWMLGVVAKTGAATYNLTAEQGAPPPPPPPDPSEDPGPFTGSTTSDPGSNWRMHDFEWTGTREMTFTLEWPETAVNLNLGLRNPSGTWVQWASTATANPEVLVHLLDAPGTWTLGVANRSGGPTSYTITSMGEDPPPPPLEGEVFTGTASASGTSFVQHPFEVTEAGPITVVLDWTNSDTANLNLGLRSPSGSWVQWAASGTAKPERIDFAGGTVGIWTIGVVARTESADYTATAYHSGTPGPLPDAVGSYASAFGFDGPAGVYPYGIDYDATDNTLLVSDVWNFVTSRFDLSGNRLGDVTTFALPGEQGGAGEAFDVEAAPDGSVWIANEAQSRVVHFDHDGNWIKTIGVGGGPEPQMSYTLGCGNGKMYWPTNIAIHPTSGNLYVSDGFCRDVSVYAPNGTFLFSFGLDLTEYGIFLPTPRGLDIDAAGDVYLTELKTRRVYKFDADGNELWVSESIDSMLDPRGLAVDPTNGDIYVVAAFFNDVHRFDSTGAHVARWQTAGGTPFDSIRYVTVDGAGTVWVGDTWGYRLWHLDRSGNVLPGSTAPQPPPAGGHNQISGIGIDQATGRLFAADTFENRVNAFRITNPANGALWRCTSQSDCPSSLFSFGSRQTNSPQAPGFNYPRDVAVVDGNVFIDAGQSIVHYDVNGNFIKRWGSQGRELGQFIAGPTGMDAISTGNGTGLLYTVDLGNCRIQIFDFTGALLDHMGTCGTGANQMLAPRQLTVHDGFAYVADSGRHMIHVWNLSTRTVVRQISGTFDGAPLRQPMGVAIDPTGTYLYIADTKNVRIVRSRLDGTSRDLVSDGTDNINGSFNWPRYIEVDSQNRLFISDLHARTFVYQINR